MGIGSLTSEHVRPKASSEVLGVRQIVVSEASTLPLKYPDIDADLTLAPQSPDETQPTPLVLAVRRTVRTVKTRWFWYAMASSICWTGWAFTAKIGSKEIPPATMEFISAFGFVLVSLSVLRRKTAKSDKSQAGKCYALVGGVLLALGGICLYGAYRTGYNASMITSVTSLYPMVTVLCAVRFLREKLNKVQVLGLCFAAAAMFILSL